MTHKIFIGYRTRVVDTLAAMLPEFQANKGFTDPKKIANDIADKKETFTQIAKDMPYTGIFDEVFLIDPKNEKRLQYVHAEKKEGKEEKSPVPLRVRNYLLKAYPNAWTQDTHEVKIPEVVFVGFNPRLFLKILGLECSLPYIGKPLPPKLWYSNSDHRDIEEAVVPTGFKFLDLTIALKRRRPLQTESAKAWDQLLNGWTMPGILPEKDAQLALELSAQLGFIEL